MPEESAELVLNNIRDRMIRSVQFARTDESFISRVTREVITPKKALTKENPASEEAVEAIFKKTKAIRSWLETNGINAGQELPESMDDELMGVEGDDFRDINLVRWEMVQTEKEDILVSSDFDPNLEGYDIHFAVESDPYGFEVVLGSDRQYKISLVFYEDSGSYHTDKEPFDMMDQEQETLISHYLDVAIEKLGIPQEV